MFRAVHQKDMHLSRLDKKPDMYINANRDYLKLLRFISIMLVYRRGWLLIVCQPHVFKGVCNR